MQLNNKYDCQAYVILAGETDQETPSLQHTATHCNTLQQAYVVLAGETDQYAPLLPQILEKLMESLRLPTGSGLSRVLVLVHQQVFLCMRVLLLRLSGPNLVSLWYIMCCSVLQCVAVCCSVLQCCSCRGPAWCRSGISCVAVCCSVLQCVGVCCSAAAVGAQLGVALVYHVLQSVAICIYACIYTHLYMYVYVYIYCILPCINI